jgi:peptidoglycan hydrolase-like protein with peptidoglycan-binding domain
VPETVASKMKEEDVKKLQAGLNDLIDDGILNATKLVEDGIYGSKTTEVVKALQQKIGVSTIDGKWGPNTYDKFHNSSLSSYKTGGLADFTGPAWLDGTKSKPEYILNAE